jgi:hypothetical protein
MSVTPDDAVVAVPPPPETLVEAGVSLVRPDARRSVRRPDRTYA